MDSVINCQTEAFKNVNEITDKKAVEELL